MSGQVEWSETEEIVKSNSKNSSTTAILINEWNGMESDALGPGPSQ